MQDGPEIPARAIRRAFDALVSDGAVLRDDYANAARVLAETIRRLSSPKLVAFANEVPLPSYQHQRACLAAGSVHASTDKVLEKRRMLAATQVAAARLAPGGSEEEMGKSFRTPPKGTEG